MTLAAVIPNLITHLSLKRNSSSKCLHQHLVMMYLQVEEYKNVLKVYTTETRTETDFF